MSRNLPCDLLLQNYDQFFCWLQVSGLRVPGRPS